MKTTYKIKKTVEGFTMRLAKRCEYCGHLGSKHFKGGYASQGYGPSDVVEWECKVKNCECSDDCNPKDKQA